MNAPRMKIERTPEYVALHTRICDAINENVSSSYNWSRYADAALAALGLGDLDAAAERIAEALQHCEELGGRSYTEQAEAAIASLTATEGTGDA